MLDNRSQAEIGKAIGGLLVVLIMLELFFIGATSFVEEPVIELISESLSHV